MSNLENFEALELRLQENSDAIESAFVDYFEKKKIDKGVSAFLATEKYSLLGGGKRIRPFLTNEVCTILGGKAEASMPFAMAVEMIKRLRFDKCFITTACISAGFGLSIQRTAAISFFKAVMDSAKKSVGLYPKEKIGFDSIVSICPAESLDMLITDWDAAEEDLQLFEDKGIELVVVEKEN